jgi:hypothetical protein
VPGAGLLVPKLAGVVVPGTVETSGWIEETEDGVEFAGVSEWNFVQPKYPAAARVSKATAINIGVLLPCVSDDCAKIVGDPIALSLAGVATRDGEPYESALADPGRSFVSLLIDAVNFCLELLSVSIRLFSFAGAAALAAPPDEKLLVLRRVAVLFTPFTGLFAVVASGFSTASAARCSAIAIGLADDFETGCHGNSFPRLVACPIVSEWSDSNEGGALADSAA